MYHNPHENRVVSCTAGATLASAAEQHLLYVANPGTRNYVEYGGVGISVFDIGQRLQIRPPHSDLGRPEGKAPENVKGIAASARTGRVYVTSLNRMVAIDAISGKKIWDKTYEAAATAWQFRRTEACCTCRSSRVR